MAIETPWETKYPTQQDTPGTEQPDMTDDQVPGSRDGTRIRGNHFHTLRDKLQDVAEEVGDDSDLPSGSLKARVTALEAAGSGQTDTVTGSNGITNVGDNVDADLAPTYGSAANTICEGDDARLSDSRDPNAHASDHENGGGDEISVAGLSGALADDQNADAIRTTTGPTLLAVGGIADGEYLRRSGATVVGGTPGGSSPLTTKGDLFGYDTGDARIPVGTNGQVLTADSAEALGVKWDDAAAGGGTAAPSLNVQEDVLGSTFSDSPGAGSWTTVTGLNITVETKVGEWFQINFGGSGGADGTNTDFYLRFAVDGTRVTYPNVYEGLTWTRNMSHTVWFQATSTSHTITVEAMSTNGGTVKVFTGSVLQTIQIPGSGAGGTITAEKTGSYSGTDFSSSSASWVDVLDENGGSAMEVAAAGCSDGDDVVINFIGYCWNTTGTANWMDIRVLKNGTDVVYNTRTWFRGVSDDCLQNFTIIDKDVADGTHTYKLQVYVNTGMSITFRTNGSSQPFVLSSMLHRGGLVPIEDGAGVEQTSTPTALKFANSLVEVDADGKATITPASTAPGDVIVLSDGVPSSTLVVNSASDHQIMPESGSLSFEARVTGTYAIHFSGELIAGTANSSGQIKLVFDEGETNEQFVGYNEKWQTRPTTGNYTEPVFRDTVELTAGTHTVKAYGKLMVGTSWQVTAAVDHPPVLMLVAVTGSGAGGALVDEQSKTSDQTGLGASAWNIITELSHTIQTTEQETVELSWVINGRLTSTGTMYIGYRVDSGSWVTLEGQAKDANWTRNYGGSIPLTLAAGEHTIEFGEYHDGGSGEIIGNETVGGAAFGSSSKVTQYRGGQVPIEDGAGSEVTATPRALQFANSLVEVDDTGRAIITPASTAPGVLIDIAAPQPTADIGLASSPTWTQCFPAATGESTFEVPVAGRYRLTYGSMWYKQGAGNCTSQFKMVFDEGETNEQTIGDDGRWRVRAHSEQLEAAVIADEVELAAGTHTLKGYGKWVSGTGMEWFGTVTEVGSDHWVQLELVSGSSAAGILPQSDTLSGDYTVTGSWADTGLSVTIDTADQEQLLLTLAGWVSQTTQGSTYLRFVVDSTNYDEIVESNDAGFGSNVSMSRLTAALDAGSHTIKVQAYRSAAALLKDGARLDVVSFRGGQVPIEQAGVEKTATPRAIDFEDFSVELDDTGKAIIRGGGFAPGTRIQVSEGQPAADITFLATDTQIMPEPPTSDMSFHVPIAGKYSIEFTLEVLVPTSAGNTSCQYKLVFDSGETYEQTVGYDDRWQGRLSDPQYLNPTFMDEIELSAGNHTVIAYAKEVSGSGAKINGTASVPGRAPELVLTLVAGSGAGGVLTDVQTNSSDVPVTSTPVVLNTHTIDAFEGEEVLLTASFPYTPASTSTTRMWYRVDSGSWVEFSRHGENAGYASGMDGQIGITLTAGPHTIEFGADTTVGTTTIQGTAWAIRSTVWQFRGGSVQKVVAAETANRTLTSADSGKLFTNEGATGQIDFTLPTCAAGLEFEFAVLAAQILKVITDSTADDIRQGSSITAGVSRYIQDNAIGTTIKIVGVNDALWLAMSSEGAAWTFST